VPLAGVLFQEGRDEMAAVPSAWTWKGQDYQGVVSHCQQLHPTVAHIQHNIGPHGPLAVPESDWDRSLHHTDGLCLDQSDQCGY